MKFVQRHSYALLAFPVLIAVTLGCLGGGASDNCEGIVKASGKTYVGKSGTENQAGLNACNKFCLETDSEFDGMYQVWLDSSEGKELAEKRKRKPTKQEAIMENERLLDHVTKTCANRCVREAGKGKHTLDVKCRK